MSKGQTEAAGVYAGIELNPEGVQVVVLRFGSDEESPGVKLVFSESTHLFMTRGSDGSFGAQTADDAARITGRVISRLKEEHKVPEDHIFLIGTSDLQADPPDGLAEKVKKLTGKSLTFLDPATDAQLAIAGTIPQRERAGDVWVDIRNSSMYLEINSKSILAGYQLLRYRPPSPAAYEFLSLSLPGGTTVTANSALRSLRDPSNLSAYLQRIRKTEIPFIRESLQKELSRKPGLSTRSRVYLSGEIGRALVFFIRPGSRENFVPITEEEIIRFADNVSVNSMALFNPDPDRMDPSQNSPDARREMESIRDRFTAQQLLAGAEILKAVAAELRLREKTVVFSSYGNLSRIMAYLRLQVEK